MIEERRLARSARRTEGFALVAALVILVIFGSIGASMVALTAAQQQGTSLELLSARAWRAAESGVEWAVHGARASGACAPTTVLPLSEGALAGFQVTVRCQRTAHREGTTEFGHYAIEAEARFGTPGRLDFVNRVIQAVVVL